MLIFKLSVKCLLFLLLGMVTLIFGVSAQDIKKSSKEQVLDFSAGVIEGELNRPRMVLELGSDYNDFNDVVFLREDFNDFHQVDSKVRYRYVRE